MKKQWTLRGGSMSILPILSLVFTALVQGGPTNTVLLEEFEGATAGTAYGIAYAPALDGLGAVFSRTSESRVQYPLGTLMPTQGTLEWWIKVKHGYHYYAGVLYTNQDRATFFTTGYQDVAWPGNAYFNLFENGDIEVSMSTSKYGVTPAQTIMAYGTAFRFGEWHAVGVSFGSQGQYLMLDGQLVASNAANTQVLGTGGAHDVPCDVPTLGAMQSCFFANNQYEGGFEGMVDRFRISSAQQDWFVAAAGPSFTNPPVIVRQPLDQVTFVGGTASFDVIVSGARPLSYQWRFNGADLPGETNATLTLSAVRLDQFGAYSVAVSNAFGGVVSSEAALSQTEVVAWGWYWNGRSAIPATAPAGLSNVVAIAAGGSAHSVALKADGTVVAWGHNDGGQLEVPPGLANVVAIAAGYNHSLALDSDGTLVGWGTYWINGSQAVPSAVPTGLTNVVAMACGMEHSLALKADGTVVAWGYNCCGQTDVPPGLSNVVAIAAGENHSLALKSDGSVVAWGSYWNGERELPMTVPLWLSDVVAIGAGSVHCLALKADGTVAAWGAGAIDSGSWPDYGQSTVPPGLSNAVAISAGGQFNLVLKADGTVVAWGRNRYDDSIPVSLGQTNVPAGLTDVVAIAAGGCHGMALLGSGPRFFIDPRLTGLADHAVLVGSTLELRVAVVGVKPMTYQWRLNGTNLLDATNAVLRLTDLQPAQTGAYSVVVSNAYGVLISPDAQVMVVPLLIEVHPQNQVTWKGATVRFDALVESDLPVTYQWRCNEIALDGATNSALVLFNVLPGHSGRYSVAVSSAAGSVTSAPPADLTVLAPPKDQALYLGSNATLCVTHRGTQALLYQWRFNGADLPGATNACLELTTAQASQAGEYQVVVSTPTSTVLTSSVALTVVSYAPVKGTYHGLFYEADGVRTESSGAFTLSVGKRGFYSAELQAGEERFPVSGRFALDGRATNVVARDGTSDLTVEWMLDTDAAPTNCLTGRVIDGAGGWVAELLGDRAPVCGIGEVSPYKGKYTFILPGTHDPSIIEEPAGDSCGTAVVDAAGVLTFNLVPAVGPPITQRVQVSTNGIWALYVPMQGGKGALVGWVHLMTNPPPADSLRSDRVFWARPAKANAVFYPNGFEVVTSLAGSRYKGTTPVLPFGKGMIVFSGGNLPTPLTNVVKLTATNTVINRGPLPLTMTITRTNGCFDGTVTLPGTTTSIPFQGVILQGQANGCGFFRNEGQVGRVYWEPVQ